MVGVSLSLMGTGCGLDISIQDSGEEPAESQTAERPDNDETVPTTPNGAQDDGSRPHPMEPNGPDEERVVNPNYLDQSRLFHCDGAPTSSPARLRRMDRFAAGLDDQ